MVICTCTFVQPGNLAMYISDTVTTFSFSTELEHTLTVTASSTGTLYAGNFLTLTCTAVSDRVPQLTWIGPNGAVVTGSGTTVSSQIQNGRRNTITLTFNSIRTSHAGYYNCTSKIMEPLSTTSTVYLVRVRSKYLILWIPNKLIIHVLYKMTTLTT